MNPIYDPARQDFLRELSSRQRVQVTRLFLQAVIPGISDPPDVCAAVRCLAMTSAFRDDHPSLSPWLVHQIDGSGEGYGPEAVAYARWSISWLLMPRTVQVRWLDQVAGQHERADQ